MLKFRRWIANHMIILIGGKMAILGLKIVGWGQAFKETKWDDCFEDRFEGDCRAVFTGCYSDYCEKIACPLFVEYKVVPPTPEEMSKKPPTFQDLGFTSA